MTSTRRRIVGFALLAAGVLALSGVLIANLLPDIPFTWAFQIAAFALALAFITVGLTEERFVRLAFSAAAVGWLLIGVTSVIAGNPGIPGLVGEALALVGGVLGGVLVYRRRLFGGMADLFFLFAMGVTGLYLLFLLVGTVPAIVQVLIAIIWGADLVISAIAILRRR